MMKKRSRRKAKKNARRAPIMAREEFIDNLRAASRFLFPPKAKAGDPAALLYSSPVYRADLWLTPKSVAGFTPSDWPANIRTALEKHVAAFLALAEKVPGDKPATKSQSQQARKHLEAIIDIVGKLLLPEWLDAQGEMVKEAELAATAKGWYHVKDFKEMKESLLGTYKAPRLRIRTATKEVVLDPVARFGSGRRGVVDLVVLPSFETAYLVAFQEGAWQIISPRGSLHRRPFTQSTLIKTLSQLSDE
jgi:hypothetical protein